MIEGIVGFIIVIGLLTLVFFILDPKKFREQLGAIVVYLGFMYAFLGFAWFGVIMPGVNSVIAGASSEEMVEVENFIDGAISWAVVINFCLIGIMFFLTYYSNRSNKPNV